VPPLQCEKNFREKYIWEVRAMAAGKQVCFLPRREVSPKDCFCSLIRCIRRTNLRSCGSQHLPKLATPTMFVEGTNDPFGTIAEIEDARKLIPAKTHLVTVEGVGHDLGFKGKKGGDLPGLILDNFLIFFTSKV
jgi:pimeloyl-ACP methyl ester carboxylesterase